MSDTPKRSGPRPDTSLVQAGRRPEWLGGMVNVPVARTSTVLFDSVAELRAAKAEIGTLRYGLQGTQTHWSLSEALTALEPGAAGTALVPSGLAAVTAPLLALLSSGEELLMVDSCYFPTRHFCDTMLARYGIRTTYYDPLATPEQLEAMLTPATKAIFLESPGSQTFEVQDVPGICRMARGRGVATLLDNTWATPLLFQALSHGVDIAILACTKYVAGHSDVLLGSVTATAEYHDRIQQAVFDLGHAVSPDDAYLAARGLRTMHVRMKRHEASALEVAQWLKARPEVGRLLHPAFEDCPGHALWKRDFAGSSSLFAFTLASGGADAAARMVDALEVFGIGFSFGGFESLALPVHPLRTVGERPAGAIVRLHIGLEDPRDLIDDLDQALRRL